MLHFHIAAAVGTASARHVAELFEQGVLQPDEIYFLKYRADVRVVAAEGHRLADDPVKTVLAVEGQ